MTRRDISLTLALCASLTLHALLLGSAAEWYTLRTGRISLPGFPKRLDPLALIVQSPSPRPDQDEDPMQRLGDSLGKGEAIGDAPGDLPMEARQAMQDQPFLSLDPAGPGKIGEDPTDSMLPLGHAGAPAPPVPVQRSAPPATPPVQLAAITPPAQAPQQQMQFGVGSPPSKMTAPFVAPTELPASPTPQVQEPDPSQPSQTMAATPPSAAPQPQTPPSAVNQQLPSQPGAETAADPAPQGSTESDPSSTRGSVDFRAGSTNVRLGRKFKLTRPRLSLAASSDLMSWASPTVVLKLTIDETGNVISAEVYRSSRSTNIDQPCLIAAYNWWFEPTKDSSGRPVKDVILFTIRFF